MAFAIALEDEMLLLGNRLQSLRTATGQHSHLRHHCLGARKKKKKVDAYCGRKAAGGGGSSDTSGKKLEHVRPGRTGLSISRTCRQRSPLSSIPPERAPGLLQVPNDAPRREMGRGAPWARPAPVPHEKKGRIRWQSPSAGALWRRWDVSDVSSDTSCRGVFFSA